ncbi:MAG: hypothetical protein P8186_05775, partial [Anaerolineae bacterium]
MKDNLLSGNRLFKPKSGSPFPGMVELRAVLMGLLFVVFSSLILVLKIPPGGSNEQLDVGNVVQRDVLAPERITYVSEIQTEAARARAEAAVTEVYDAPDTRVARQQVARARQIFDYFDSVRADNYASLDEKRELIAAVNDLTLTDSIIVSMLTANSETWAVIKAETITVLDQAMRAEIRPNQLAAARRRLPMLLDLDVSDQAATVVIAIVEDLIQPNTFVNEERTAEERQSARENVQPVVVTYEKDQRILRAGDLVRSADVEALEELGLQQPAFNLSAVVGDVAFITIIGLIIGLYLLRLRPRVL